MMYAYEDLSDDQFETLIVLLCQRLFGLSTKGFTKGPDGGRDAKFVGVAELHPSKASPWSGTTIIQAKHTNGYNRSFSETDFFNLSNSNTIIGKEIPRIQRLRSTGQLDHYILFANRRLSGDKDAEICQYIADQCNIPKSSVYLCDQDGLDLWLKRFPDVARDAKLDPIDSPLIVGSEELAEIIETLAKNLDTIKNVLDDPPSPRVSYEQKNSLNGMTSGYAKAQRKKYLKNTVQIYTFLASPQNAEYMRLYESVVDEFQLRILSKRKNHQTFDEIMEYLTQLLFNRDPVLRQSKRLTRTMLFYMYWNCDIGEDGDVTSN